MSLANENIEQLISLCKQNNQKAQLEVYNRYCKAMYNVALRIVKDEHFAEDVMQEAFLKAFQKLETFKGEVAFGAWLKRIVINYSIDFYKKNSFFNHDDYEAQAYKIEDTNEDDLIDHTNLKVQEIMNAMQKLKESYRMILTLVLIEGYDLEEVCEIINISYANCRTTLSRAKESLRMQLASK
ncbi:MAG TPA: RNA polymerase sigma factor [Flavobacterium sp.]|uniref:RNA polymerase sigma factor n=1 Tax=unclassified Flavobacterium TaxID=196869 RepID=UPI000E9B7210|nr:MULTISPECIES: RNA polymerase sigma factor [unclassified Flavobacterium]HBI01213.1 RNA polymerase subunit sigma [Flavobacterium sp.]HRE78896.1 RNA polymerase sigma factor [Flavobacterium sp.]